MKNNKLSSIILSLLVAFGLWAYVVNNVSVEDDDVFYNIPVVLEGEAGLADRNLMITSQSTHTVSLHLSGSRSDLNKVNSGNITIKANLATVDEPGERIGLSYTISYPGDVPSNAFVVESRNPSQIYINVDHRRVKDIPVTIQYTGTRMENFLYDTENAELDNSWVNVSGPAAVVDRIASAVVEVDLTERMESVSESFRYTLCDEEGEPVDAAQIVTNLEQVRLELPIRKINVVTLLADVNYGGGANEKNTIIRIEPQTIRVSGGEAVLKEFGDTYTVGPINLADLEKSSELTFPITLPEGITNQTGVTEVKVSVRFSGLKTKEFVIENIESINIPEGLTVELISTNLTVKVRGPAAEIDQLTEEDITARVDFSAAEVGSATYRASVSFGDQFPNVGAMKTSPVSATVQAAEEE